jgi:pantoate--beta-alanine ligase
MPMEVVVSVSDLRARVAAWRRAGERVGLVPTMGNLHEGHLELVKEVRPRVARTVASVFVNPMQFGAGEDFASYPRTLDADREKLAGERVDLLFAPSVDEVYPRGRVAQTRVEVPGISDILCGASRPGHFVGVATVVCKLFNMAQPDLAVFGEKDFQQLLVIRRMAADLCMPVEILGVPTVREPDGLAMSSRNGYLSVDDRRRAPRLYAVLQQAAQALRDGEPVPGIERESAVLLQQAGFLPDYVEVRRAADLERPDRVDRDLVILAAARLGNARLIDNLRVRG